MASSLKLAASLRTVLWNSTANSVTHISSCCSCLFYQQTRHLRKRSHNIPAWRVKQYEQHVEDDISVESEKFIKTAIHDHYKSVIKSPLKEAPWERGTWTQWPKTLRTGVLALKLGVLPQWTKKGEKIYTTLLQVLDNHVINYRNPAEATKLAAWHPMWRNKYGAVVVGALGTDPRMFTPEYNNLFRKTGLPPKRKLARFLVTPNAAVQPGTPLSCLHFRVGDYVDVQARTIEHGFQGVIKRWRMKGLPASHGVTKAHRRIGSIGGRPDRSAIKKGKKMPGHMGGDWSTLRGLKIWRINTKYNVLYVNGKNIPGRIHSFIRITDTKLPHKESPDNPPHMPTCFVEDQPENLPENLYADDLFQFTEPSLTFPDES
ncbi:ribosomal L3, mitochondrial-like [Octopus vulgaris]|uniref:Large ribosomal subunit protein uL3m n=1 Tax=Octopus vulgaris TaxID=6645 RepID=A0AA36AUE0_OCTVU|nr:ribosomal L3, mitochondrial-like [Octopus vulgaris]